MVDFFIVDRDKPMRQSYLCIDGGVITDEESTVPKI